MTDLFGGGFAFRDGDFLRGSLNLGHYRIRVRIGINVERGNLPSRAWFVTWIPESPTARICCTSRSLLAFPVTKTSEIEQHHAEKISTSDRRPTEITHQSRA